MMCMSCMIPQVNNNNNKILDEKKRKRKCKFPDTENKRRVTCFNFIQFELTRKG